MDVLTPQQRLVVPDEFSGELEAARLANASHKLRIRLSPPLVLGAALLLVVLLVALVGPLAARFLPDTINAGPPVASPDFTHWFGTDPLGRDLFSRVVSGLGVSLWISLGAALITTVPGVCLGLLAGYYQGWLDQALSRLMEILLSLPGLLLAIVLIARLGPSAQTTIIALGVTGMPSFYRIARSEAMSLSRQPFIEASLALGMSDLGIVFRHILPNILAPICVLTSMRMGTFLLMGSSLSFIGLGVQAPQAELGALLAAGKEYYDTAWWLIAYPGLCILLTVLGFNLFGEGLRDQFV